jgi:hypothetical protein
LFGVRQAAKPAVATIPTVIAAVTPVAEVGVRP